MGDFSIAILTLPEGINKVHFYLKNLHLSRWSPQICDRLWPPKKWFQQAKSGPKWMTQKSGPGLFSEAQIFAQAVDFKGL